MMNPIIEIIKDSLDPLREPFRWDAKSKASKISLKEFEITRHIAKELSRNAATIWTAQASHEFLSSKRKESSWTCKLFHDLAEVDIAWTLGSLHKPDHFLEVKKRSDGYASQDHYLFVSDIVALAGEFITLGNHGEFSALLVAPVEERLKDWLFDLLPTNGQMKFHLDPSLATKDQPGSQRPYWCDRKNGTYTLDHKAGFCKIFTQATAARLVGIFRRKGSITIECSVTEVTLDNGLWCLLYTITSATFLGDSLQTWWP